MPWNKTQRALRKSASPSATRLTNERAILDIRTVQPDNSAVPSEIQAELVVDGTSVRTIHYDTTGLSAGDPQRFVFDVDGSAIGGGTGSGTFPYVLPTELRSYFLPNYRCRDFGVLEGLLPNC